MLTGLAIRDVVLIEALDLDFGPGLGALTGETGAGKSILLDALGLALGVRADTGLVRQGAAQAGVTASFELPPDHPAFSVLAEGGLEAEAGEPLVIRRTVRADGGSRAFVNDQPASAGLLRALGASLVEIHGQHDDRGLLDRHGHRALLDAFGRLETDAVAAAHARWRAAEEALAAASAELETAARDRAWLEHAAGELAAFAPEPGEEATLAEARAAMQKGARLADDLESVTAHLQGSEGALAQLRQAARRLDRLAGEAPEAGVAFYSFGDPAALAAATAELVAVIRAWADPAGRRVLDLGCGIGRVALALADDAAAVTGVDVSGGMVAAARQRAGARVRFEQVNGRDLAGFADASFDRVLAVDSFPFLVPAGPEAVSGMVGEVARVLAQDGDFLVFNWSYRGNLALDRSDVEALAAAHGLTLVRSGDRPFAIWDGTGFHLRRRG